MQTEFIKIMGMTCGGCTDSVTQALKAVKGVDDVNVSLSSGEATVKFNERLTSYEQLKSAVIEAGYGVDDGSTTQEPGAKGCGCGCG
jgi:copper chaperone